MRIWWDLTGELCRPGKGPVEIEREASPSPFLIVEGRFQWPVKIPMYKRMELILGVQVVATTEKMEPFGAVGNLADLLGIDRLQRCDGFAILGGFEEIDHTRRHIEPAGFQHHRRDSRAANDIPCCVSGGPPHAGMGS